MGQLDETQLDAVIGAGCPACSSAALEMPKPLGDLGDPGYHVVAFACESCDAAVVAKAARCATRPAHCALARERAGATVGGDCHC